MLEDFGCDDHRERVRLQRQVFRVRHDVRHAAISELFSCGLAELRPIEVAAKEQFDLQALIRNHIRQIALPTPQIEDGFRPNCIERLDDSAVPSSTGFLKQQIRVRGLGPVHVTALNTDRFVGTREATTHVLAGSVVR